MKKLIIIAVVALGVCSCKQISPKMYTTFGKEDNRLGSFYSYDNLRINSDTVIEGRKVTIIMVH